MEHIAEWIVRHRKAVIVGFLIVAVVSVFLLFFVKVNYNITDYLPPDAQSTKALSLMTEEFGEAMPNTNVMVCDLSVMEAVSYKQALAELPGVSQVVWLDDVVDVKQPLEMADPDTVEGFYKDGTALFQVTIEKGLEKEATAAIQELIGEDNAVAGEAPDMAVAQTATSSEAMGAMALLIPIVLLLLILSTSSWFEPVLFLVNIGVAILLHMGTNLFLGEISFMSFSVGPILQMACSLDYGIFLMHSFGVHREQCGDDKLAMKLAIKQSMSTVAASSVTTLFGFLALTFMNFQIGADLGITLAKGIVISFLTAVVFLPAVTLGTYKLVEKTRHRPFMPSFKNVHKGLSKVSIPITILVVLLVIPTFLGQSRTGFVYGSENISPSGRVARDSAAIDEAFGNTTVVAILAPRGDVAREAALCSELTELEHVTGVMAYANTVGTAIPPGYLDDSITSQFYSEHYARIIAYTNTASEGDVAFQTVENIQEVARSYYGEDAYSLGRSATLYDMKNLIQTDNVVVNLIAIVSIFLVLLVTFRSLTLPFILLITIEAGIWINLAIPYFMGDSINFIGYLVLSTVQLGATVDYAILLTSHYRRNRQVMPKNEAIHKSLDDSFRSILVSGIILSSAGFILSATSSNPSVADIGTLLGRGALLSMTMVVCFLPAMLKLFDRAIDKTTYRSRFFKTHRVGDGDRRDPS